MPKKKPQPNLTILLASGHAVSIVLKPEELKEKMDSWSAALKDPKLETVYIEEVEGGRRTFIQKQHIIALTFSEQGE